MKKMIAGIALAVAVSVSASPHKTTDSILPAGPYHLEVR